ncbi:hypothetical protein [Candidatus Pseudomonas adelgestsugas]|nr:hypothetical protein [Candidatus Pseudomonas adelgestsugas]
MLVLLAIKLSWLIQQIIKFAWQITLESQVVSHTLCKTLGEVYAKLATEDAVSVIKDL